MLTKQATLNTETDMLQKETMVGYITWNVMIDFQRKFQAKVRALKFVFCLILLVNKLFSSKLT